MVNGHDLYGLLEKSAMRVSDTFARPPSSMKSQIVSNRRTSLDITGLLPPLASPRSRTTLRLPLPRWQGDHINLMACTLPATVYHRRAHLSDHARGEAAGTHHGARHTRMASPILLASTRGDRSFRPERRMPWNDRPRSDRRQSQCQSSPPGGISAAPLPRSWCSRRCRTPDRPTPLRSPGHVPDLPM